MWASLPGHRQWLQWPMAPLGDHMEQDLNPTRPTEPNSPSPPQDNNLLLLPLNVMLWLWLKE